MSIQVTIKTVYGNDLCYPVCDTAKLFALLIGAKTFNQKQLDTIEKLGYKIKLVNAFSL